MQRAEDSNKCSGIDSNVRPTFIENYESYEYKAINYTIYYTIYIYRYIL